MAAYVIPTDRRAFNYAANAVGGTGVVGGIPARPTEIEVDVATDGTNMSGVIMAALNSAPDSTAVKLPAGTINIGGGTALAANKHWRSLRGSGMLQTTLVVSGANSSGFAFGGQTANFGVVGNPQTATILGGLSRGSTVLQVSTAVPFLINNVCRIYLPLDPTIPTIKYNGDTTFRNFQCYVTGKNTAGTHTLTISPAIHCDYSAHEGVATIWGAQSGTVHGIGLEDLTIQGTGKYGVYVFGPTYGCWFKNVRVLGTQTTSGLEINDSVNFEMHSCWDDTGTTGFAAKAGISVNSSTNTLIVNSIMRKSEPLFQGNFGAVGTAMSLCYAADGEFDYGINTNHSPQNNCQLIEYCSVPNVNSDGYHGGEERLLVVNSHVTARNTSGSSYCIAFKRFTRKATLVGNIFRTPGYVWGDDPYNLGGPYPVAAPIGEAQHSELDYSIDWDPVLQRPKMWRGIITARFSNTAGEVTLDPGLAADFAASVAVSLSRKRGLSGIGELTCGTLVGNVVPVSGANGTLQAMGAIVYFVPSPNGFPEVDLDVEATLLRKGNYDCNAQAIPVGEAFGVGETTCDSLVWPSGPPSWWPVGYAWPPYNAAEIAANPTGFTELQLLNRLPAYATYSGSLPTPQVATPTFTPPQGLYPPSVFVTIECATVDAVVRYTTNGDTPTALSAVYSGPVELAVTSVLQAIGIKAAMTNSAVRSGTYTIGTAPTAPSGLTATPVSSTQINLALVDNSADETEFQIFRGTTSGILSLIFTTAAGATSYQNTGLTPFTQYFYRVIAVNVFGSASSAEAVATTFAIPSGGPIPTLRSARAPRYAIPGTP